MMNFKISLFCIWGYVSPPGASVWLHSAGKLTSYGGCRFMFDPATIAVPHLIL